MILTNRAEEILETLWIELIEHNKEKSDATILKDDEVINELLNSGYIEAKNGQISLTAKGKEEARNCVRRHRLAERLLIDVLDVKGKLIHETSCRFEHLLHKGLDDNICTLLGHPKTCPHGRPIPEGKCCQEAKTTLKKLIMPLTELELNTKAKVSYLQTQDQYALQKMIAMGVLPNTEIILIQKFPSYAFKIGRSQFAIDKELASCIYVRVV
jgi:DtxR family Mn-dependent transcriptional regulator